VLIAFALAALTAPDPVPIPDATGRWGLCQSGFNLTGDADALVNLVVDEHRRVQENSLAISGDFEAKWNLNSRSLAQRTAMTSFAYLMDFLPDAEFPISMVAIADGHPFWRGTIAEPDRHNGNAQGGVRPLLLVAGDGPGSFPNIFGVRWLRFVATDARGRVVARGAPRLPDWMEAERRARFGARQNEWARRREGCASMDLPV
jgi:hypothetical protein